MLLAGNMAAVRAPFTLVAAILFEVHTSPSERTLAQG